MTYEEFRYLIDTKTEWEFSYKGKNYNLTYTREDDGKDYIAFGERYMQKKYSSFIELMNNAEIENSFLREILETLSIK